MSQRTLTSGWSRRCGALCMAAAACALCGCQSSFREPPGGRTVSLAEFKGPSSNGARPVAQGPADDHAMPPDSGSGAEPSVQDPAGVAAPAAPAPATSEPGRGYLVDSLVGQVNGRPIYADEFFEPIEDQLRANAARLGQRDFIEAAHQIISDHLRSIVRNELVLAEALSELTVEEQQGILLWLRNVQEQQIAEKGKGIRADAERVLMEQQGLDVDEFVDNIKRVALIRRLIDQKIESRVFVSWREVEREYERHRQRYDPPATIRLHRLRLSTTSDAERIAEVTGRLEAGEAFDEVVEAVGVQYDVQEERLGPNGMADLPYSEVIKSRLADKSVGETTEPFEIGSSTWWLHVAAIEQPPPRSIYDPEVQLELTGALEAQRREEEFIKYLQSLYDEGIAEQLTEMADRLLTIAVIRYGR